MKKSLLIFLLLLSTFVFSQNKWKINFYSELNNREIQVFADNDEEMQMSAKFDFKLSNMVSTLPNNQIIVIPAKTKKFQIAKLSVIKPNAANSYSYKNIFNFGNVEQEKYDENYIYSLPFQKGKTQLIYQGYNGKFSHQNANALDFNLKIGDKIFAAREGKVVEVVQNNNQSCANLYCAKFNNKIVIMHSDGTFGDYAHLKFNGAEVKVGEEIKKGQFIGYSGNTGFSNGPHLHFAVFLNRMDGNRVFIPTKFKTSESEETLLKEGKNYTRNY